MMEHDIFLKCITRFIYKVDTGFRIIRIDLTATAVNRQEYRFDTGGCLCHQTGCSGWGNRQTGDIAAAILDHFIIEFLISFAQTVNKRIIFFPFGIVDFKCTTLFRHFHRRTISCQRQSFLNLFCKICSLFRTITQSQSGNHIAFSCDANTRTTSLQCFSLNFFP